MQGGARVRTVPGMSWIDQCTDLKPRSGLPGDLDVVRLQLQEASQALTRALVADWVSVAATGYIEIVENYLTLLRRIAPHVDNADFAVRAAQSSHDQVAAGSQSW